MQVVKYITPEKKKYCTYLLLYLPKIVYLHITVPGWKRVEK